MSKEIGATRRSNVTIQDVADAVGVSKMTVSRVLNNQNLVKTSTRDRVFEAMKDLNFRPNGLARSLAGGQSIYVGLIYTNPSYFYLSELLFGAMDACRERGHHVLVDQSYEIASLSNPEYIERRFFEMGIHAVIAAPPLSEIEAVVRNVENAGLDVVCIGIESDGSRLCVNMDDKAAADDIVQHLIDSGHTKIGIIQGPPDHIRATGLRRQGFDAAMERNGLEIREDYITRGDFTMLSGMEAARATLNSNDPPTAIFACNDDMAIGAIHAAYELNLRVPDDVSIVGFDDITMATSVWPPLTTVRHPIREMAASAIDLLERKRNGEVIETTNLVVQHDIAVRSSSCALQR